MPQELDKYSTKPQVKATKWGSKREEKKRQMKQLYPQTEWRRYFTAKWTLACLHLVL